MLISRVAKAAGQRRVRADGNRFYPIAISSADALNSPERKASQISAFLNALMGFAIGETTRIWLPCTLFRQAYPRGACTDYWAAPRRAPGATRPFRSATQWFDPGAVDFWSVQRRLRFSELKSWNIPSVRRRIGVRRRLRSLDHRSPLSCANMFPCKDFNASS